MKAEGIEYEERMERAQEVTYPKPLEDLLSAAFAEYCEKVPWASDYCLRPKSVLRDMVETASDFKTYIGRYKIARSEGTLLRYLSDAYRVLDRTVPAEKRDERLDDIVTWLRLVVRTTDSSLVDEWEGAGTEDGAAVAAPSVDEVVHDRRGLTLLVRNALFARVRLAALGKVEELGDLDADWGYRSVVWQQALDAFHAEHERDPAGRRRPLLRLPRHRREGREGTTTSGTSIKSSAIPTMTTTLAYGAMSTLTPRRTRAPWCSRPTAWGLWTRLRRDVVAQGIAVQGRGTHVPRLFRPLGCPGG